MNTPTTNTADGLPRNADRKIGKHANCEQCNVAFHSFKSNKGQWQRFCSTVCRNRHISSNLRKDVKKPYVRASHPCGDCSRPIFRDYKRCRECESARLTEDSGNRCLADILSDHLTKNGHRRHVYQGVRNHAHRVADREGLPKICAVCGYSKHVELSHVKGISTFDGSTKLSVVNHISNLSYLCPNHHWEHDHAQEEVSPSRKKPVVRPQPRLISCVDCGAQETATKDWCKLCGIKRRSNYVHRKAIQWPDADRIVADVLQKGYREVARNLGVSDNAVRKHLKTEGVAAPTGRLTSDRKNS